jgi:hypothetical protein
MWVTEASLHRSRASFSAKFVPQRHLKHLSGLLKRHVAPYDSFSILGPTWRDGWRHLRFLLLYSPRWLFLYPGLLLILLGLGLGAVVCLH